MGRICAANKKRFPSKRPSKKRSAATLRETKWTALRSNPYRKLSTKANADVQIQSQARFEDDRNPKSDPQPEKNTKANSHTDCEIKVPDPVEDNPGPQQAKNIVNDDVCRQEVRIEGRRIVDISYMLDQIHDKFDHHNTNLNCSFRDVIQTNSRRYGLQTQIFSQCRACMYQDSIWTDRNSDDTMTINRCAVAGSMATGIGYSQMEELLSSMNIPCMSSATYRKHDMEMVTAFEKAAATEMRRAAEIAKQLALERGDFIVHEGKKIPFVTVVADCGWMTRSYRTGKYDSLSGCGTIVEHHTGKVIFTGVRNKACAVCEWATRHNVTSNPHQCFKNWGRDQASTGMEADALLEGFLTSVETLGLIFKTLIADGDSNVYKTILDNDPYRKYGVVVEKKECVNHLLRNLSRKIKDVAKTKGRKISGLKKLVGSCTLKFRESIEMAIANRQVNEENHSGERNQIDLLRYDVLNAPYHVFGDHRKCNELKGFCDRQTTDEGLNLIDDLKKAGLFQQLEDAITYLAFHSDSLFYHANNNAAETFNSIVCKLIGGKRINFGMRGSFQARCAGSAVQYNTQNILTNLHESEAKAPPTTVKSLETRRQRKVANNARLRQSRKLSRRLSPEKNRKPLGRDKNYGPNAERPDITDAAYDDLALIHRSRQLTQQENRVDVEKNTRGQCDNGLWTLTRSKMLTASNFGKVCRMYDTTSCSATVKAILYPSVKSTPAMVWGQTNESKAIEALEKKLAAEGNVVTIKPCGLFIDRHLEFLGASPDGIIDNTSIVEVKCPRSAQNYHPEDAVHLRVTEVHKFFDVHDRTKMNKSHPYYYQVQGQLHITQADICYFTVWSPLGLKYVKVPRDDEFWSQQMEPRLTRFYTQCLLPEIIDPRALRNMPIREPEYILEARRLKIQAAEASKVANGIHGRVIAVPVSAATSEEDDAGALFSDVMQEKQMYDSSNGYTNEDQTLSAANERKSKNRADENQTVRPLKLIRQQDSDSWTVSSSDEHVLEKESGVPILKLVKRRAGNEVQWSTASSSDERCSSRNRARIPPLKLLRNKTELGHAWVLSDDQESDHQPKLLPAAVPTENMTAEDRVCSGPVSLGEQAQTVLTKPPPVPTNDKLSKESDVGPWVVISDDGFTERPTEIEIEVLESINKNVPIAEVRRDILSKNSLLNDTSIDQFLLVIKNTTNFNTESSLWLVLPRFIKPSCSAKDIHIIGGNAFRHWRCTYFDGTQLFVYDSLGCDGYQSLKEEEKRFISLRYPNLNTRDMIFPATQKQPDNYSCGVFAAAFATTIGLGKNPSKQTYSMDIMKMRNHLLQIIESKKLIPFPNV